jgi:hypothetical protein
VTAFLDHGHRLQRWRGNIEERRSTRWNKWLYATRHYQRESIDQPDRPVIIVVIEPTARLRRPWLRYMEKMRVHQPGVIVVGSGTVPCVNVLKRRQNESRQQSHTRRQCGETTHSFCKVYTKRCPIRPRGLGQTEAVAVFSRSRRVTNLVVTENQPC